MENYEDPEEKVRAEFFAELIYKYEYPATASRLKSLFRTDCLLTVPILLFSVTMTANVLMQSLNAKKKVLLMPSLIRLLSRVSVMLHR